MANSSCSSITAEKESEHPNKISQAKSIPDDNGFLRLTADPGPWIETKSPTSRLLVKHLLLDFEGKNEEKVQIGDSIRHLTHLTQLIIRFAESIRCLPDSIATLHNLKYLKFINCRKLPANLGVLKASLTHLSLYRCVISKSLSESFANLSNLTSLHISFCDPLTEFPASLGQLVSLQHLLLENCDRLQSLPNTMANLKTLCIKGCLSLTNLPDNLNVSYLKLLCSSIDFIPRGLFSLRHLEATLDFFLQASFVNLKDSVYLNRLTIDSVYRSDEDVIPKLTAISNQFARLQILSFAALFDLHFVKLPAPLNGLKELILLDIRKTRIKYLPWSITDLNNLKFLFLPWDFCLDSLPSHLNDSVLISVVGRHVRETWKEFKQRLNLPVVAAWYPSIISPPGYLLLEENLEQWISKNYKSCMLVTMLELVDLYGDRGKTINALGELSNLTHLFITRCEGKYLLPNVITGLKYLSFEACGVDHQLASLANLTNLQSLDVIRTDLPVDTELPVSLTHLSLRGCSTYLLPNSIKKLSNLLTLELFDCGKLSLVPENLSIVRLKLDRIITNMPLGLLHLDIFHFKEICCNCDCGTLELCLNQLVNLETLSITCYFIESLPSIARLQKLRVLQLKDCFKLSQLPSDLDEVIELHTIDISGTGIKSLPAGIMKLSKLQHLILPKCFKKESLLMNFQGVIIDDTDEIYYKFMNCDSRYETSPDIFCGGNDVAHGSVFEEKDGLFQEASEPASEYCDISQLSTSTKLNDKTEVCAYNQHLGCSSPNQDVFENGQDKLPQSFIAKGKPQKMYISKEMIQQCLSKNMTIVDAAIALDVSRSTLKRRLNELCIKWQSSKKGKQKLDSKKRKFDPETHCGSNSVQHMVNTTNYDNIKEYIVEANQISSNDCAITEVPRGSQLNDRTNVRVNNEHSGCHSHNQDGQVSLGNDKEMRIEDMNQDSQYISEKGQDRNHQTHIVKARPQKIIISQNTIRELISEDMRIEDAAKRLGVSRSTLQRRLRELKINWPSRNIGKQSHDTKDELNTDSSCLKKPSIPTGNVQERKVFTGATITMATVGKSPMDAVKEQNIEVLQHTEVHSNDANQLNIPQLNEDSRTFDFVKAFYAPMKLQVRIDWSVTFSVEQLNKTVSEIFELEMNTFYIEYLDEEEEWCLMTRISDLRYALIHTTTSGKKFIRLSVTDKGMPSTGQYSEENLEQLKKAEVLEKRQVSEALNEQSTSMSEGKKFIQHPKRYFFPFLEVVPCILPFIIGHKDVKPDGNCGFRTIALFVYGDEDKWFDVRQDLLVELIFHEELYIRALGSGEVFKKVCHRVKWLEPLPPAPVAYWFETSDLGLVVATKYQRIFVYWSKQSPTTFFPLQARLGDQPPTKYINITRINNNHFIALYMSTTNIPLPPPTPLWKSNCEPGVKYWFLAHFKKQLDWYNQLFASN